MVDEENLKIRQAFEYSQPRPAAPIRFTKFRDLVPELRNLVWDAAISNSGRVVEFAVAKERYRIRFYSTTGVPEIMMVNHEARKRALQVYGLLDFGRCSGTTYINWEVDTVLFKQDALQVLMDGMIEDYQKGRCSPILKSDSIAVTAAKSTIHQQINRNCRNLGVIHSDFYRLVDTFEHAIHFPSLKSLAYISVFDESVYQIGSKNKDGRVTLSELVDTEHSETEDIDDLPVGLLPFELSHSQLYHVSVVHAFRSGERLLTGPEKQKRKQQRVSETKQRIKHEERMAQLTAGLIAPNMNTMQNKATRILVEDENEEEDVEDGDQVFLDGDDEEGQDGEFFDEEALARE